MATNKTDKSAPKPKSENSIPDDNVKKRSIDISESSWKLVEKWAAEQDKSRAAIVRACIDHMADRQSFKDEMDYALTMTGVRILAFSSEVDELFHTLLSVPRIKADRATIESLRDKFSSELDKFSAQWHHLINHKSVNDVFAKSTLGLDETHEA